LRKLLAFGLNSNSKKAARSHFNSYPERAGFSHIHDKMTLVILVQHPPKLPYQYAISGVNDNTAFTNTCVKKQGK
jgi:hypothetical protein